MSAKLLAEKGNSQEVGTKQTPLTLACMNSVKGETQDNMEIMMWLQKTEHWFYCSHMSPHSVPWVVNLLTSFISQIESLNGLVTSCSEGLCVVGDLTVSTGR